MKKGKGFSVTAITLLFSSIAFSQDAVVRKMQTEILRSVKKDIPDSVKHAWKKGIVFGINAGQGTLSNWAAGGDDFTLTISTGLNLFGFYKKNKHSWDNTLDVNFGYIKTTTLGSRKNDDRFDLLSKYGYALDKRLNLASAFNFRSQFFKGFTYKDTLKTFSSDLLSPGYLLVSLGLDYKPVKELSIFFSPVTSRWIIIMDDSLSAKGDYGVKPGKHSINELGSFATINYQKSFNKYVSYKGRLDLFSNYKKEPKNVDLYMTNMLTAKVARIIAFSWNLDMIYDDDVKLFGKQKTSPALQLKSIVGVGLQVKF
ncbi:MAG TPA: DUF3078 domain-containing protein [Chitinophagaceae bacterium]